VFQLVKDWGNDSDFFNIETKLTPYPDSQLDVKPEEWVTKIYALVKKYNLRDLVMLQSFDWRMKESILMHVDGIITDRPASLRQVCQHLGIDVPSPDPAPQGKPHFSGSDGL
jgi:glycerophosphoryl diester phosphodiesterase